MPSYKQLENFNFLQAIDSNSDLPRFSHALAIYEKVKNKKQWYVKYLDSNVDEAINEVVAQEFFRLILPFQPKTRLVKEQLFDGATPNYYVISKALKIDPHFFSGANYIEKILKGNAKGLGKAQVVALWLNETDFKAGNVVLNEEGEVIKLDGGQCFSIGNSYILGKKNFDITVKDLESLPLLTTYTPANWLDFIFYENGLRVTDLDSPLLAGADKISTTDNFKQEINQTILHIICLPEELIAYFVKCYTKNSEIAEQLIKITLERQRQLKEAAYKTTNFTNYIKSEQAESDLIEFVQALKTFKTIGHSVLLVDIKKYSNIDIEKNIFEENIKGYAIILNFYNSLCGIKKEENSDVQELKLIIEEYLDQPTIIRQRALCEIFFEVKERAQDKLFLFTINELTNQLNYINGKTPKPNPRKILDDKIGFFKVKARSHIVTIKEALFGNEQLQDENNNSLSYQCTSLAL